MKLSSLGYDNKTHILRVKIEKKKILKVLKTVSLFTVTMVFEITLTTISIAYINQCNVIYKGHWKE